MIAIDDEPRKGRRDSKRAWDRREAQQDAEIGPPPERNWELWHKYRYDLLSFLVECFPNSTGLKPFSDAHVRVIRGIQKVILHGGQELEVVFRGFAKSTITELAIIWAAGYGHRKFFVPISANDAAAKQALDSIKSEFAENDKLMELFPAVCHAVLALEGKPQRCGSQTCNGERTHIQWKSGECVLPDIEGFEGSAAIIRCVGITSNTIRGMRFKRPDGEQVRPDFVMIDDPQTDESAASPLQVEKLIRILRKTILRLGGRQKEIAIVINATIIQVDDMIHRMAVTERKQFARWRVNRVPMLLSLPKKLNEIWLGKYAEIRTTYDEEDESDQLRAAEDANKFYEEHRDEMDEGAEPSWEHCYIEGSEVSAIQHAINIIIDTGMEAFMAECQSDPMEEQTSLLMLSAKEIMRKQSTYGRNEVPGAATVLTCFVDVHPEILYWQIWAWEPNFTGYLINYGTFPDQRIRQFVHAACPRPLSRLFRGMDEGALVFASLDALIEGCDSESWPGLHNMEWIKEGGAPIKIGRFHIDANGSASDAVKKFARKEVIYWPSFGEGIPAKRMPISRRRETMPGDGPEWTRTKKKGDPQGIRFDTNWWKAAFHRGLALPEGSKGCLSLYKHKNPEHHRPLSDHWLSEKPKEVSYGSHSKHEFDPPVGSRRNDYFDCAVGAMVAASCAGIKSVDDVPNRRRMSMRDYQKEAERKRRMR